MTASRKRPNSGYRSISVVLFMAMFAAQAGAIVISPVLVEVARDLDVSTAAAGQLRTVAGLVAGLTALTLGRVSGAIGLGRQLLCGSALLALGSLGSAMAPSITFLAVAQVPVGAGIAILTTVGTLAAAEWTPPERRTAVLSWALIGQPAAWIVGMPLVAAVGERSWRYAWLVLPLSAAILAGAAVARRIGAPPLTTAPTHLRAALAAPGLSRWLVAELLSNTAWAGTLVYAGALLVESYGTSGEATGAALAVGAGAYVAGNLALRRLAGREPRRLLVALALALGVAIALFGAWRPSWAVSTVLFSAAAFIAGGRTFLSSAAALAAPSDLRPAAMAMRGASMQFGYFLGSFTAGAALALGGYAGLGLTAFVLLVGAAVVLRTPSRRSRSGAGRSLASRPVLARSPDGTASTQRGQGALLGTSPAGSA